MAILIVLIFVAVLALLSLRDGAYWLILILPAYFLHGAVAMAMAGDHLRMLAATVGLLISLITFYERRLRAL